MQIKSAEFIKSSSNPKDCPTDPLPEYAFIGRSNVGKSSLINMLTGRKALAKTSVTPGKTQLINHFLINQSWFLVDLPGIGYAKVSHKEKSHWNKMITDYLFGRETLMNTFVLLDSRLKPQAIDLEFMDMLESHNHPFSLVFTKTDKVKKIALGVNINQYQAVLQEKWKHCPPVFLTSSIKRNGGKEILDVIENLNAYYQSG